MSRQIHIVTPENIEISFELAGVGSRFMAAAVDHLLQLLLILAVSLAASLFTGVFGLFGKIASGTAPAYVEAIVGLIGFAIFFGYFAAFELLGGGRTPGKRLVGLRVVRDGGHAIDPYASIVRNLVRIVDMLPMAYAAGMASIFFSPEYKRLGDYAGGTLVIKERGAAGRRRKDSGANPEAVLFFRGFVRNMDRLTDEEFQAIRRFVDRRHELEPRVQAHIAQRLAVPILARLEIEAPISVQLQYADMLEAIEQSYVEERGVASPGAEFASFTAFPSPTGPEPPRDPTLSGD